MPSSKDLRAAALRSVANNGAKKAAKKTAKKKTRKKKAAKKKTAKSALDLGEIEHAARVIERAKKAIARAERRQK